MTTLRDLAAGYVPFAEQQAQRRAAHPADYAAPNGPRRAMTLAELAELGAGFTPGLGDLLSARDAGYQGAAALAALAQGDWRGAAGAGGLAALGAAGVLPFVPGLARGKTLGNLRDLEYNSRSGGNGGHGHAPPENRGIVHDAGTRGELGAARAAVDPEGRPLGAPVIAGIREAGGPDIGLDLDEERRIAEAFARTVDLNAPASAFKRGTVGHVRSVPNYEGRGDPYAPAEFHDLRVKAGLPADRRDKTFRHEVGHLVDIVAGKKRNFAGLRDELKAVYGEVHFPGATPRAFKYPEKDWDGEYIAEAIYLYKTDPRKLKEIAPKTAKFIRDAVNGHYDLKQVIQFNQLAPFAAGAGLAGLAALSAPGDAAARDRE